MLSRSRAGIPPSRFFAFQADPTQCTSAEFLGLLQRAAQLAGWPALSCVDAALAIFVLSAVPPPRLDAMVGAIAATLRPDGGVLCVRDYGLYDMPMLRFMPASARGRWLYERADGTLARFFDRQELVDGVLHGAAKAGIALACDDSQWCTTVVHNRAKQIAMRRVFVHAQFTRHACGDGDE